MDSTIFRTRQPGYQSIPQDDMVSAPGVVAQRSRASLAKRAIVVCTAVAFTVLAMMGVSSVVGSKKSFQPPKIFGWRPGTSSQVHVDAFVESPIASLNRESEYQEKCEISSVCFALDQSWSIYYQYGNQVNFVAGVAEALKAKAPDLKLSAVGFAWGATVMRSPTTDLANFTATVRGATVQFGNTNINAALATCYEQIKNDTGTGVIMLLTDGNPTAGAWPVPLANTINSEGIDRIIMTVAMGGAVSEGLMKSIAKEDKYYFSSGFANLPKLVSSVTEGLCTPFFTCTDAYEECDFRFEGTYGVPTFDITGRPDMSFTPGIVSSVPGEILGHLNSNNIPPEFILAKGVIEPITKFGSQYLTPNHFKPLYISQAGGTGIGHQTFHGNQLEVSQNKCVRLYFTSYQTLDPETGHVKDNKNNVARSENKCIVFRTM